MNQSDGLLKGLKVLELAQYAAGPFAGMLLADLGADVVKVERPESGDLLRGWAPHLANPQGETFSASFAALNRGKRSVTLDLANEEDHRTLLELVKEADILLENFRPGVLPKLGLGYEQLRKVNPRLVYCSVTGYGQSGPYAQRGAFDVTVQGESGLMSCTGTDPGEPVKCGVPVADFTAALYAAFTILAAVRRVEQTGAGAYLDCPMLGCLLGISALQTSEYFATDVSPGRLGSRHPKNAPYQGFQGNDKGFVIAAGNDKLWQAVCDIVGKPALKDDPRFNTVTQRAANQIELAGILQPIFSTRTAAEWLEAFDGSGVPSGAINSFGECLNTPQAEHMGLVRDMTLPNGVETKTVPYPVSITDFEPATPLVPRLGEHNQQVLEQWLSGAAKGSARDGGEDRGEDRVEDGAKSNGNINDLTRHGS